jgi:hypothetical protein
VFSGRDEVPVGPGETAHFESPEDVDDWVWVAGRTSDAAKPRTEGARYSPSRRVLEVRWTRPGLGGGATRYFEVGPRVWQAYTRAPSRGGFIRSTLDGYRHENGDFG